MGPGANETGGLRVKVLVVDGHPAMRLGLKGLLGVTGDMWVVGETGDGCEALDIVEEVDPHLVIVGLNLAGEPDGVEVCWQLKALPRPPRVLVHTSYNFTADVSSCLLAGADGYLHKSACCEEFLTTVRRTALGERVWRPGGGQTPANAGNVCLTPKEKEILLLMLRGLSNAEMTRKLYLSLPTIRTHVRNVLRKLGAKNRKELFQSHALEA